MSDAGVPPVRDSSQPEQASSAKPAPRSTGAVEKPVPLSPHEQTTAVKSVAAAPARAPGPEDEAVVATPPTLEDGPPLVDEAAEAAFLAEAKERGEVVPRRTASDADDEPNAKSLPPLDDLVKRIPADVRETLEDLFRARFTTVKKFPKRALKG